MEKRLGYTKNKVRVEGTSLYDVIRCYNAQTAGGAL